MREFLDSFDSRKLIIGSPITLTLLLAVASGCRTPRHENVGTPVNGAHVLATYQLIQPAGESVEFAGRPVDLALAPKDRTLYVKDNRGLVVLDTGSWQVRQELKFTGGGSSFHGLVVTRDGSRIYATTSQDIIWEVVVGTNGALTLGGKLSVPGPKGSGNSVPTGITLSSDERTAFVCLSRNNSLGILDLPTGKLTREIPVGVAPFDVVLTTSGKRAFVSNWGGRHPRSGEERAKSAGTDALIDARGVAASGTVSVLDLEQGRELVQIDTGLHPSDLELSPDQRTLYVANANSDSVTVISAMTLSVIETFGVRPDAALPFGSAPNALSLSPDGQTLYVANGGNNAIAVVVTGQSGSASQVRGFIPTAWYPGGIVNDGKHLFIANTKGLGSRDPKQKKTGWNSHYHLGTVSKLAIPTTSVLAGYTRHVKESARVPQMLRALEKSESSAKPVPVPNRWGAPSVFDHVVYIIKENRTYDQVFGDLPQGNSDTSLCVFGREVTPNHHALAEEFVLLDNYYCNGVLSADGHAWATEGHVTDYLEKSFGGWTRSYPFAGDDPLSFASSGFIWDQVLLDGLSFRNYGEMSKTETRPAKATFLQIYEDYRNQAGKITFQHDIQIENLRRYSCSNSPGWQLRIPDLIRADVFLKEFTELERTGTLPNLVIIFLPSDHTSGTSPGSPTPRAQVADNDLAVGRIVERVSQSRFWPKTCIFVIEDDPQNGFDHVDGHRSLCLVASPYTKRGVVVSKFYNQTSVLHTMSRLLGIPPMNQMVALAPLMTDCFTSKPNLTPYRCRLNNIPLNEMNKSTAQLEGQELHWALASTQLSLNEVDCADNDTLNRIIWHAAKGSQVPYPAQWAGAHGRGLGKLGLRPGSGNEDDFRK
jgi:YVTN family beta-propeller protein